MNKLLATLLATAAGATIASAPAAAQTANTAGYQKAMQKIEADHKAAKQKCDALKDEDVCEEQADVARARAELAAVTKYNNTGENRDAARRKLADAEYDLAEEKCDAMKGNQKDSCMNTAKSARTAALASVRGTDSSTSTSSTGASGTGGKTAAAGSAGLVATTDTKDPVKAAAVDKCEKQGNKTACLVENKDAKGAKGAGTAAHTATGAAAATAAARTETAAERAGDKTRAAASTAAEKTKDAAATAVDKTKQVAKTVAEKTGMDRAPERAKEAAAKIAGTTERAAETAVDKTKDVAATAADKTRDAASTAAVKADNVGDRVGATTTAALSDTAITTKVKAGLAAEPDLSALAIKVETEQGVVMLSGFVDSPAAAAKAEQVAKGVEGVTTVKSAITVK